MSGILATQAQPAINMAGRVLPVIEAEGEAVAQQAEALLQSASAEVQVLTPGATWASSIWSWNPFERGRQIEAALAPGIQLPPNYPTIDTFQNGLANSIKSINLNAATYQDAGALLSRLTGYINSLSKFQGADWGNVNTFGKILARQLTVAIPPNASAIQTTVIQQAQAFAQSLANPVKLIIVTIQ